MAFFHGNKGAPAGVAHSSACDKFGFHGRSVICGFDDSRLQRDRSIDRCWPKQFYVEICRYSKRHMVLTTFLHKVIGRCPVRVTVEQRADYPAVQNTGKRLVVRLRSPLRNDLVTLRETADVQPFHIRRSAAETNAFRRIFFLQRFLIIHDSILQQSLERTTRFRLLIT